MSGKQAQRLKVYLRQRPWDPVDPLLKSRNIIASCTKKEITLKWKNQERKYKVDRVFGEETSQLDIYNTVAIPYINDAIAGYNCTILAYGPTGTGKTFTIFGDNSEVIDSSTINDSLGLVPRVAKDLFIGLDKLFDIEYTLRISFVEIYNDEVRDLFQKNSLLRIYDDPTSKNATYFKGLREITICTLDDFFDWLSIGQQELQTSATKNNLRSSRSHTILTFSINTQKYTGGEQVFEAGKLQFVDLAGSEPTHTYLSSISVSKKETVNINKSIFTLGNVLKALTEKQPHVPYRDCKLTRVLQDSLGGNAKTSMIATFLPTTETFEETISALEVAAVARNITNSPRINITRKLNDVYLEEELSKLKKELAATHNKLGCCITSGEYEKMSEEIETHNLHRMNLIEKICELEAYKQAKTDDYINLLDSIAITKMSLAEKEQKLKEISQVVQEQEQIVKDLEKHDTETTQAVGTMFNICETVLDDKMTYHEKYDKQQDITRRNADHAQFLINNSINGLEAVKDDYHSYTEYLESRIILQQEFINRIMGKNKESLTISDHLCQQLLEKSNSSGVHLADLSGPFTNESSLKLSTRSFENIQELIQVNDKIFDRVKKNNLLYTQTKLDWTNSLQRVVDEQIAAKKKFFSNVYNQFDELDEEFRKANDLFDKRDQLDDEDYKTTMQYFTQAEELNMSLKEQTCSIEDKINNCYLLCDLLKNDTAKPKLDEFTNNYITLVHSIESDGEEAAIEKLNEINRTEAKYCETISSHIKKLELYNEEMKNTIMEHVDASNKEQREMSNGWSAKALTVKNTLNEIQEDMKQFKGDVEALANCSKADNDKHKELLQNIHKQIETRKNSINYMTHDGDTPAKRTLTYPRMPKLSLQQNNLTTLFDESPTEKK